MESQFSVSAGGKRWCGRGTLRRVQLLPWAERLRRLVQGPGRGRHPAAWRTRGLHAQSVMC